MDEAYCLLEDMADFDHWSWNSLMNNQALVAQFLEETKLRIEMLERMEVLRQLQAELVQTQVELSRMNAPPNNSIEATKRKALMELFEDDFLGEEETQDLYIDKESQEEVYESRPLVISIVMPPPIKHDHIYEDSMWPTPPPPSLAPFVQAH
ncbi:hypothetical protein TIFTF001_028606 [Ficus carica]|uniref:Uncharacterized protein n=1 Tax=Ficus carica TaxID=3494 RepID=A0AA88DQ94_FICCA|nr:hypothetical protein TIFTF001_028606 [Ficus carica]